MGSDPTWQNWCLLLRSTNSYFMIDIRLESTTVSKPQQNVRFLAVVFTHMGKIYTQIYTRKSKTLYKNELQCSWKLTDGKNTFGYSIACLNPIFLCKMYVFMVSNVWEHSLRRLLCNTKGKVLGRERKRNYDNLENSFYLQRFINLLATIFFLNFSTPCI